MDTFKKLQFVTISYHTAFSGSRQAFSLVKKLTLSGIFGVFARYVENSRIVLHI